MSANFGPFIAPLSYKKLKAPYSELRLSYVTYVPYYGVYKNMTGPDKRTSLYLLNIFWNLDQKIDKTCIWFAMDAHRKIGVPLFLAIYRICLLKLALHFL